jgi:hypothetical protein
MSGCHSGNEVDPRNRPTSLIQQLNELTLNVGELLDPVIAEVQAILNGAEGIKFHSLAQTKAFATWVRNISAELRCEVQCPYCGQPGYFTGQRHNGGRGSYVAGAFLFYHRENGKTTGTHGGVAALPKIVLIRPPREELLQETEQALAALKELGFFGQQIS